ncbi:MAG: Sapep family Mn(2+)-dependent dipeptidase [Fimbriimonadaceae bacterium]|nr:Sapep family Mn(2+)-dependent dipeptidase [Fimbriimonadaceae bacterium]
MSDTVAAALDALASRSDEMLEVTRDLLRIPSLEADPLPGAPFGAENRKALDFALDFCRSQGLETRDIEGYCGWAEFGSGPKMVAILGHLDVVPVGPGWKFDPFGAEIQDGWLYARGASDDKGPTVAALFAALALRQAKPDLGCRVRIIFGCNEESGFKCIHRYNETEEEPTFGIAPDAGWPLIHAEKGIADFVVGMPVIGGELELVALEGGQRPNIVIDSCCASVRVAASARAHVESKLADSWDRNLAAHWEGDLLQIHATGKAAHGSWPYGGDNAAIRVMRFLMEIAPLSAQEAYEALFETAHIAGLGLGIAGADEPSGPLSANLGIIRTREGMVELTMNVRYPVTWKGDDLRRRCEAHLAKVDHGLTLLDFHDSPPLYFPLEHPLVQAVCEAYTDETGEIKAPGVMGGGTYARAVANSVAIGTGWQGDGPAHQTDERIGIEHQQRAARIYVRILDRLTDLAAAMD